MPQTKIELTDEQIQVFPSAAELKKYFDYLYALDASYSWFTDIPKLWPLLEDKVDHILSYFDEDNFGNSLHLEQEPQCEECKSLRALWRHKERLN